MGQFIDHDITHTPNHAKKCCNKDGSFPDTFDSNKCFPIEVPSDDPFWKGSKRCMDFARSLSAPSLKCEIDSRQQVSFHKISKITQKLFINKGIHMPKLSLDHPQYIGTE